MIDFQELCDALDRWRTENGLTAGTQMRRARAESPPVGRIARPLTPTPELDAPLEPGEPVLVDSPPVRDPSERGVVSGMAGPSKSGGIVTPTSGDASGEIDLNDFDLNDVLVDEKS
jgi:hypothetical protein